MWKRLLCKMDAVMTVDVENQRIPPVGHVALTSALFRVCPYNRAILSASLELRVRSRVPAAV